MLNVSGYKMTTPPKHTISSADAMTLLNEGRPLTNLYVEGELKIETSDPWDKEITIENCVIENFSGSSTLFIKQIKLKNSNFKTCQFIFTYFVGGLTIDNCIFNDYLNFQAGGHNKTGNSVIITNNIFNDFVNFFDCWYENEVTISNNKFHKGTNLLGEPLNMPVTFDKEPIIKNNIGQLDLDNEGY